MIVLESLSKYFHRGGVNEVLAIDRVNLTLQRGDFVTLIGSNGAGKSTLLNCVAGTYPQDSGRLLLDGTDIGPWPEHRRAKFIGRVFQNPLSGTCASLTIEQNMALAMKRGARRGLSIGVKAGDRGFWREKLAKVGLGLEDRLKAQVGLLSGGQRQALTMVMATLVQPEILLLDEHTAALDPRTALQILELTRRIVYEQALTTLMVTHNMKQALALGNRLVMMHRGRIVADIGAAEKETLGVEDLMARFYDTGGEAASDRMLLV